MDAASNEDMNKPLSDQNPAPLPYRGVSKHSVQEGSIVHPEHRETVFGGGWNGRGDMCDA